MKVLMITPEYELPHTSGVGIAVKRIADALADKVSLTILKPHHVQQEEDKATEKIFSDANVVRDITHISVHSKLSPYANTSETFENEENHSEIKSELSAFTKQVVATAQSLDFDCIYAHDWVSFEAALALKELYKKPLILHAHSLDVDRISTINHSWVYGLEQHAFEQADMIVAVSHFTAQRIQSYYGIHPRKIFVIYNGVDSPKMSESYQKKFKEPVVLFVGRLSGQKAPKAFLEIAEKIRALKSDVRFMIAGDGDLMHELLEMTAHKDISDSVHFTGYVPTEDMGKIYAEATVLCMPSTAEPFGLVALEATAAGLPVILTSQSGATEVMPHASKADPKALDTFAEYAVDMILNKTAAKTAVEKNQKSIKDLTWQHTASQVHELLAKL